MKLPAALLRAAFESDIKTTRGLLRGLLPTHFPAMPEFPHLSRAPIVEAIMLFQANASQRWKPEQVRKDLQPILPEETEAEELSSVKLEFVAAPGRQPEQRVSIPGIEASSFARRPSRWCIRSSATGSP